MSDDATDLPIRVDGSTTQIIMAYSQSNTFGFHTGGFGARPTVFQLQCNAATTCSGRGTCSSSGTCECDTGYTGANCLQCASGFAETATGECTVPFADAVIGFTVPGDPIAFFGADGSSERDVFINRLTTCVRTFARARLAVSFPSRRRFPCRCRLCRDLAAALSAPSRRLQELHGSVDASRFEVRQVDTTARTATVRILPDSANPATAPSVAAVFDALTTAITTPTSRLYAVGRQVTQSVDSNVVPDANTVSRILVCHACAWHCRGSCFFENSRQAFAAASPCQFTPTFSREVLPGYTLSWTVTANDLIVRSEFAGSAWLGLGFSPDDSGTMLDTQPLIFKPNVGAAGSIALHNVNSRTTAGIVPIPASDLGPNVLFCTSISGGCVIVSVSLRVVSCVCCTRPDGKALVPAVLRP